MGSSINSCWKMTLNVFELICFDHKQAYVLFFVFLWQVSISWKHIFFFYTCCPPPSPQKNSSACSWLNWNAYRPPPTAMCPEDWARFGLIFYWRDLWSLSGNHVPGSCCGTGTLISVCVQAPCRVSWVHGRRRGEGESNSDQLVPGLADKIPGRVVFHSSDGPCWKWNEKFDVWETDQAQCCGWAQQAGARPTNWPTLNDWENIYFLNFFLHLNTQQWLKKTFLFLKKKKTTFIKLLLCGNQSLKPFHVGPGGQVTVRRLSPYNFIGANAFPTKKTMPLSHH